MKPPLEPTGLLDLNPTRSREALRRIIEVLRDGHQSAVELRESARELTATEVELQLEAIEDRMIEQITEICGSYHALDESPLRH